MTGCMTPSKRRTVFARDGGQCHYCPEVTTLEAGTVDHVWPRALNGVNANWNLVWSCGPCNEGQGHQSIKCDCLGCKVAQSRHGGHWLDRHHDGLTTSVGDVLREALTRQETA